MKNLRSFTSAIGLLFLLAGCGSHDLDSAPKGGGKKLSGRQVREVVHGSTVRLDGYGQEATVEFTGDGTMTGTNTSGQKDKGMWQVKEDDLCLRFKEWAQGDTLCYQVVGAGSDYQLFTRKGLMVYDLTLLSPGGQEAVPTERPAPARVSEDDRAGDDSPPPSARPISDLARAPFPASPQAGADVEYIIRQSAQNCPGCNLAHAQLSGQTLIGANLQGANLTEADLSHANLRRANLRGANLYRANLQQADLAGADLTGANLTESIR